MSPRRPPSARLFAALELPPPLRIALAGFAATAAASDHALRPVGEDALHLTLAFLGHRPLAEVDPAAGALLATPFTPPRLGLGDPLWLSPRRPHVLTIALEDPDGTLAALHADVTARLAAAIDWKAETRPFRPHVTVARVRHGTRPRRRELPDAPRADFTAAGLVLFRSHLGGGPARYEPLARVSPA